MAETNNTNNQADTGQNGGNNAQNGGNSSEKTYTQQELDKIVDERTGRATKSALSSFFKQKGLSEDEVNSAIADYLDNRKKNTPDVSKLQSDLASALDGRTKAQINQAATLEAIKQGATVDTVEFVLRMADFSGVVENGEVNGEKLSTQIKNVLDKVPALKPEKQTEGDGGFSKIGGDGKNDDKTKAEDAALRKAFGLKN